MGRRGKQQARHAAAPTAAAAAAEGGDALELEPAWCLLLGQLGQPPEQLQVVCRLLCCSSTMARLVHAVCAGQVHARISRQPSEESSPPDWQQQVTAQGEAYCRWLAKHARLLAELQLERVWPSQEQYVAAGLRAAAGIGTAQAASGSGMRMAAAAAAAGPAEVPAARLPLRSLVWDSTASTGTAQPRTGNGSGSGSGSGSLLDSLAACPQLERLQYIFGNRSESFQPLQRLAAAVTALRGLRELSLHQMEEVVPLKLQLGTQLTKLRLRGFSLTARAMCSLPPSLADLEYQTTSMPPQCDIAHLSALARLVWPRTQAGDKLPPRLEWLHVRIPLSLQPLHPLTRLQSLQLGTSHLRQAWGLQELQAAVAAIGSSLTALDLTADDKLSVQLLTGPIAGPPVLPLTGLAAGASGLAGAVDGAGEAQSVVSRI